MRYAILSDIHANLEGLTVVLNSLRRDSIDAYYCIGDIVGYGANPNECIDEIRAISCISAAGNHDWAAAGIIPADYFNDFAREAVEWTGSVLTSGNREFLRSLGLVLQGTGITLVHGTLVEPHAFHYMFNCGVARETFEAMQANICFVGHTHIAGFFVMDDKEGVSFNAQRQIRIEPGHKYIVNAGSVGQPRDNNPRAAYCVFDTASMIVQIKRESYDVVAASRKILDAGLPRFLAERIMVGQ